MDRHLIKDISDRMPKFSPEVYQGVAEGMRCYRASLSRFHAEAYAESNKTRTLDSQVGPVTANGPTLVIVPRGITTKTMTQYLNTIEKYVSNGGAVFEDTRSPLLRELHRSVKDRSGL